MKEAEIEARVGVVKNELLLEKSRSAKSKQVSDETVAQLKETMMATEHTYETSKRNKEKTHVKEVASLTEEIERLKLISQSYVRRSKQFNTCLREQS